MYFSSDYTWLDLLPLVPFPVGRMRNGKWHFHSWAWGREEGKPYLYCGDINCDAKYHPKDWMLR